MFWVLAAMLVLGGAILGYRYFPRGPHPLDDASLSETARYELLRKLGANGDPVAFSRAREWVHDKRKLMKLGSIEVLGSDSSKEAGELLLVELKSTDSSVHALALDALARGHARLLEKAIEDEKNLAASTELLIAQLQRNQDSKVLNQRIAHLLEVLKSVSDSQLKRSALEKVFSVSPGYPDLVPVAKAWLGESAASPGLRASALGVLFSRLPEDAEVIVLWKKTLHSSSSEEQRAALQAVGQVCPAGVVQELKATSETTNKPNADLARAKIEALGAKKLCAGHSL